jgi:CRISPR-associated protein Cas1
MIKRTLYFGNPAYLSKKDNQMLVKLTDDDKPDARVPIEDIGVVILDHYGLTLTHALISALQDHNVAIISCDQKHLPYGMMLPFWHNHSFTDKIRQQIAMSEPLKKNLWQQTIVAKIKNQAALLEKQGVDTQNMHLWARKVKSGDTDNMEARAARYYWNNLFRLSPVFQSMENKDSGMPVEEFRRERFGLFPNNLLNYAYAILRAVIARSLVGSGLLPALGIWHANQYNPFCLADDVMEPYRPFVDQLVLQLAQENGEEEELSPAVKRRLLEVPVIDLLINKKKSPLMVACRQTTASLMQCVEGKRKKIKYPAFIQ